MGMFSLLDFDTKRATWSALTILSLIIFLVLMIPFIGWVLFAMALGGSLYIGYDIFVKHRVKKTVVPVKDVQFSDVDAVVPGGLKRGKLSSKSSKSNK